MKIAKWIKQRDGNWAWVCQNDKLATVSITEHGTWEWSCPYLEGGVTSGTSYHSAENACLAAEKHAPIGFDCWFESKLGGYLRPTNGNPIYVRKTEQGWYAVRADGRLLGRRQCMVWFGTAEEAFKAVERRRCTPNILDPSSTDVIWCWIRYTKPGALAT
jgi:hypothetical protein